MDNDTDLLETNRFIKLNIVDQDVSFLNTSDRYMDFLKKTERDKTVDESIEDDLLAINADDDIDIEDDVANSIVKSPISSFAHEIDSVFSIDSRHRDIESYPNPYQMKIFLGKEFSFLDLIQLIDVYIPYVPGVYGMEETVVSSTHVAEPVPYLYMRLKIDSFPDNILNNIITPISNKVAGSTNVNSTVSIFAKIGLSILNPGFSAPSTTTNLKYVYNRIIYGSTNFNDTLSVVRAASSIRVEILSMDGRVLDNKSDIDDKFLNNSVYNWNMTIRFVEKVQLLKSLNVNSLRSVNIDPRALAT